MKIITNICLFLLVFAELLYACSPGLPVYADSSFNSADQIVTHTAFILRYNDACEQASWVAYKIEYNKLNHSIKRTDDFRADPKVLTGSAIPNDYRYSGYDRGHLAPAASMKYSEVTMSESFYMSNMSPQHPRLNRGIWQKLEDRVRQWAKKHGTLYVVSGPVLKGQPKRGTLRIGGSKVCVPDYYYKVVLDYTEPGIRAIGFLFPNTACEGDLGLYTYPVDFIEAMTGLDFFPDLPDHIEDKIESESNHFAW